MVSGITSGVLLVFLLIGGVTTLLSPWLAGVPKQRAPEDQVPKENVAHATQEEVRLSPVDPRKSEAETDIDIIAIHGFDTKSPDTWIHRGDDGKGNVNWLSDEDMLPSIVRRARIFTCNWPARMLHSGDLMSKTIPELGRGLLCDIQRTRPEQANDTWPILFIASCLGGNVLMEALLEADRGTEYAGIRKAAQGVIFLATPFRGTAFQDIANWAAPVLNLWASLQNQVVSTPFEEVKGPTQYVRDRVRRFTRLCLNEVRPCRVATFHEKGYTVLQRKFLPRWMFRTFLGRLLPGKKQLVDHSSGTLDIDEYPLALNRTHVMMNKFSGPQCPDYQHVAQKIKDVVEKICEGAPINRADRWIREHCYSAQKLKIERLSGETLPMDQCYINLTIVQQLQEKKLSVDLRDIFDPREKNDGSMESPKRIFIRGHAGVGKTTLCKKIIHEYIRDGAWKNSFDRLLWIPLRNLKGCKQGYNLRNLFCDEYFSQHPNSDSLAKALHREVTSRSCKTLFILDGLDEIVSDLNTQKDNLVTYLLEQPCVIITSRPNANLPTNSPPVDLEMEAVGFHRDQVNEYLRKVVVDPEVVHKIKVVINQHPPLESLAQTPILLDALCYTWDDVSCNRIPETMTALYKAIEQSLWKKDADRLEKEHVGRRLTKYDLEQAGTHDIGGLVKGEIRLLEALAFTGLHKNILEFDSGHRDAVSQEFRFENTAIWSGTTLPRLSFLRTSDASMKNRQQSYHFLHLTIQEYFAAQYFVRQWTKKQSPKCLTTRNEEAQLIKPAKYLEQYKYLARYNVFWRFVAGLFDVKGKATAFFAAMENEPRDLLGLAHHRLIVRCLGEVNQNRRHSTIQEASETFQKRVVHWLLFDGRSGLSKESAFPFNFLEDAVLMAIQNKMPLHAWCHVLYHMAFRVVYRGGSISSELESTGVTWMIETLSPSHVYHHATACLHFLKIFSAQAHLSEGTLRAVADLLLSDYGNLALGALEVLEVQNELTDKDVLEKVTQVLVTPHTSVRKRRVCLRILERQSELPETITTQLTELVQPEYPSLRSRDLMSRLKEKIEEDSVKRLEEDSVKRLEEGRLRTEYRQKESLESKSRTEEEGVWQPSPSHADVPGSLLEMLQSPEQEHQLEGIVRAGRMSQPLAEDVLRAILRITENVGWPYDAMQKARDFLKGAHIPRDMLKGFVSDERRRSWVWKLLIHQPAAFSIILDADITDKQMVYLCIAWLEASFEEGCTWHIHKGSLYVGNRNGFQKFDFGSRGTVQEEDFRDRVAAAMRRLRHPEYINWDSVVWNSVEWGIHDMEFVYDQELYIRQEQVDQIFGVDSSDDEYWEDEDFDD